MALIFSIFAKFAGVRQCACAQAVDGQESVPYSWFT
jgi:hypothetical protein